jgi:hypothetical protein
MRIRYAVALNGRICRIVKTLKEAIGSMAYHPNRGGQIFEIEYSCLTNEPNNGRIVC